jgi:hypothetical protein
MIELHMLSWANPKETDYGFYQSKKKPAFSVQSWLNLNHLADTVFSLLPAYDTQATLIINLIHFFLVFRH